MLKQGLELKQTQKLSPLQIQTIKLIELPVQELEQRIRKELEENPVLDEDLPNDKEDDEAPREVSLSEYKEDDSIPSYRLRSDNYSKDERPQYNTFSVKESFTQSLMEQLGYRNLSEHQYAVASGAHDHACNVRNRQSQEGDGAAKGGGGGGEQTGTAEQRIAGKAYAGSQIGGIVVAQQQGVERLNQQYACRKSGGAKQHIDGQTVQGYAAEIAHSPHGV